MQAVGQRAISGHVFRVEGKRRPVWRAMSNATKLKILTILSGVFERARKVHRLPRNPMAAVEKPIRRVRGDIDVFSVEEVMALVRAAADEQDAAIYLTAALTGLRRGELVALRWRDVDLAGQSIRVRATYTEGGLTTPESGKVRGVPMAPQVSAALARLAAREAYTGNDDLVFPGTAGGYLDASALYRRYKRAGRVGTYCARGVPGPFPRYCRRNDHPGCSAPEPGA
jgi:integrase